MKTALACLFFPLFNLCTAHSPGLYIDNGVDQTILDMSISRHEQREIELEILNLLGLPDKPRRPHNAPLRKSAPRFLMDIYSTLVDENSREKRSVDLNLSGDEQNAIEKSDVIMTFESIGHHVSSVRHERGKRLWFNVSEVPVADSIVGAELRIYQNANFSTKRPNTAYTVTVYQLINAEDGERELEYISATNTTTGYSGWLGLNLTGSLATWVAFPESNKGLYLSVHPVDRPGHEVRPEDIGLVTIKGEDETQPFMVAFLQTTNQIKPRSTRDIYKKRVARKSEPPAAISNIFNNPHQEVSLGESKLCRLQTLHISFKDLQWQDWIIAPDGYSAYFCAGECNFPLNSHMNATNHAIVQTLVSLMKPLQYPKPCCAPTKLSPLSVLYFLDESSNVVLKKYKKMIVKSCGCL